MVLPSPFFMEGLMMKERGVALIETAVVMPLLIMVVLAGAGLGLALVAQIRLQAAVEAAAVGVASGTLGEDDAGALLEVTGGELTCLWVGVGDMCSDDGLDFPRVQLRGAMVVELPFFGEFHLEAETVKVLP